MCGRFSLTHKFSWREYAERLAILGETPTHDDRYNARPGEACVVIVNRDGRVIADQMRWGFQPDWMTRDWMRAKKRYSPPINARAETIFEGRSMWARAARIRRCVLPCDGFYEPKGPKSQKKRPQYYFQARGGAPMSLAALWTTRTDEETGEVIDSFAIVTMAANEQMAPIHDRMPILLRDDEARLWLDPAVEDVEQLAALLSPKQIARFDFWRVSDYVNKRDSEGPACIEPAEEEPARLL
ncbi:MAG: SOS response-associated peptidase [Pseudomonadota bacterium]